MGDRPASTTPAPGFVADLRQRIWSGREGRAKVGVLILATAAYAFWPTLSALYAKCVNDPQYSHGLLVPLFVIGLLWTKRDQFPADVRPAPQLGFLLLLIAVAARVLGGVIYFEWLEAFALLP